MQVIQGKEKLISEKQRMEDNKGKAKKEDESLGKNMKQKSKEKNHR